MKKEMKKSKSWKERGQDIQIIFNNAPSPELWSDFRHKVFAANMREHVPAHQQQQLLKQFVAAGLMTD